MTSMKAIQAPVILIIKRIIQLGQATVSVSVDEFLPIKAHLNKRGRLIHHYNKYDA